MGKDAHLCIHAPGGMQSRRRALQKPGSRIASAAVACCFLWMSGCGISKHDDWHSRVLRAHALVGRIWDVKAGRQLDHEMLSRQLAETPFVLLGEKHDNADHHLLQARILDDLAAAGRRPAVTFEMLSVDIEPVLTELFSGEPVSPEDFRRAVRWDDSGWPSWALYEPVVAVALRARLPIVAGDLDPALVETIQRAGATALSPRLQTFLALQAPLPADQHKALVDDIVEAHCGRAPERLLERMVDVQRARDAQLARAMLDAAHRTDGQGAVLIAGIEHVRADRAVPAYLARWAPDAAVASVAFLEILPEYTDPAEHLVSLYGEPPPFDYVWFTPRVDDTDPCERFEDQLRRLDDTR